MKWMTMLMMVISALLTCGCDEKPKAKTQAISQTTQSRVPDATVEQAQANIAEAYKKVNAGFACECGGMRYGIPYENGKLQRYLTLDRKTMKWYDVYLLRCNKCGEASEYRHPCPHLDMQTKP